MKTLILAVLMALAPIKALAVDVIGAPMRISTDKVVHIPGIIDDAALHAVRMEMELTKHLPGDRLVLINSGGGIVPVGEEIIKLLREETLQQGTRLVCVADHNAHSMAFNLMTACDVRLATPGTKMLMHHIAVEFGWIHPRLTGKLLRAIGEELRVLDNRYDRRNARALHIPLKELRKMAESETTFDNDTLEKLGYLNAVVVIAGEGPSQ